MQMLHIGKVPGAMELHPIVASKPADEGWLRIKGVMDSGASESGAANHAPPV